MSMTSVAAVRCSVSGRSSKRASANAENVATAATVPAGIVKRKTRSTNPGM